MGFDKINENKIEGEKKVKVANFERVFAYGTVPRSKETHSEQTIKEIIEN